MPSQLTSRTRAFAPNQEEYQTTATKLARTRPECPQATSPASRAYRSQAQRASKAQLHRRGSTRRTQTARGRLESRKQRASSQAVRGRGQQGTHDEKATQGRKERGEDVTYKTTTRSHRVRRRTRSRGLNFRRVDLAHDGPGRDVSNCEDKYRHDNDPARCSIRMHDVRCVQRADKEHGPGEDDAAADGGRATTPLVGEERGGNAEGEHEDGGDPRSEEGGCLR